MPVIPGVTAEFISAGHLLGSAYARVRIESTGKTILFGGDLGRYCRPVLPDPAPPGHADVLLVESTYGDRVHAPDDDGAAMADVVNDTVKRGGKLIIPAFALGRVEELLYWIQRLEDERRIPELPVYVDSPMAAKVLEEYRHASRRARSGGRQAPWRPRRQWQTARGRTAVLLVLHGEADAWWPRSPSRARCRNRSAPAIVISSSGMATGGRVLHHLARALPESEEHRAVCRLPGGRHARPRAEGRRAIHAHPRPGGPGAGQDRRHRLDVGARRLERNPAVAARVSDSRRRSTCLVHGEPGPMDTLKARIREGTRLDRSDAGPSGENRHLTRTYLLEQVDDAAVVQYYADGFPSLPLDQKILVWHLYQAAHCGPRHLLRPALPPRAGDARDPRRDPDASGRHRAVRAGGDPPLHQAVLDQLRARTTT